jgi:hypothetical protein
VLQTDAFGQRVEALLARYAQGGERDDLSGRGPADDHELEGLEDPQ